VRESDFFEPPSENCEVTCEQHLKKSWNPIFQWKTSFGNKVNPTWQEIESKFAHP
jgi:hypothetical protein